MVECLGDPILYPSRNPCPLPWSFASALPSHLVGPAEPLADLREVKIYSELGLWGLLSWAFAITTRTSPGGLPENKIQVGQSRPAAIIPVRTSLDGPPASHCQTCKHAHQSPSDSRHMSPKYVMCRPLRFCIIVEIKDNWIQH